MSGMSCISSKPATNTAVHLLGREYNELVANKSVTHVLRDRFGSAQDLFRKDLYSHYGCVNAIEFSDNGQYLVSGGDDRRILLWDIQKAIAGAGQPQIMKGEHNSNIFCLGFDSRCHRLFSAGNDELVMIHDAITGETVDVILHNDAIYGLSVNPSDDNVFASACDDGRVCIWDLRKETSRETAVLARYSTAFHAVMYNPFESRLVVTANTKEGIAIWDVRKPLCVLQQFNSSLMSSQSAMSVRFNKTGTLILALRRRLPPVLYNLKLSYPIVEFDDSGYYNSCTMKSCCFGGDSDQYVLSGSDDFKLYVWKIPEQIYENGEFNYSDTVWVDGADLVLSGHRSIVNQVRYNYTNSLIASSGVEKVIKLWSSFPLPEGTGNLQKESTYKDNRQVFSHEDYINLVLESGQFVTHDYSHQSVQEDPRMMAFFDSLVQRDIEGWTTDSSDSIDGESNFYELCWNSVNSDDSHTSNNSSLNNSDNEESIHDLNSHCIKYLDIISKRVDASEQMFNLKNNSKTDSETALMLTTTKPELNTFQSSNIGTVNSGRDNTQETGESSLNRISELITEKKREQLRKLIKFAVRTTRKKLKRSQKRSETKSKYNVTDNRQTDSYKKRLEDLNKKLDYLAQRVNCNINSSESKTERHRNYRRLRFLTNQSDLVFNEVVPIESSSSSSNSDDSDDEIYNVISNEMNQIRAERGVDSDSSDSSSDDSSCLTNNDINNKNTNNSVAIKCKQNSSDEETVVETSSEKPTNGDTKHNHNKTNNNSNNKKRICISANFDDSDSDQNDETNDVLEPVIHCPYKHNLCHATTSATNANSDVKKSSIFKPINTRRRSYRKRQRSGTNTKDNNEDNVNNDNKDDSNPNNNVNNNNNNSNSNDQISDKNIDSNHD